MSALQLCEKVISLGIIFQMIELWLTRASFSEHGVWRWSILAPDFRRMPGPIRFWLLPCLSWHGFSVVLGLRMLAAVGLLFLSEPGSVLLFALILWITTLLVCVRWRGTYNGGSDSMTLVVLTGIMLAQYHPAGLWYIALQATASYWVAGVVKLRSADWRQGRALIGFLNSPGYDAPDWARRCLSVPRLSLLAGWGVILFECTFPLSFIFPKLCLFFLIAGFSFHFINVYLLGLNRFLFAWTATYPVIYYLSQS